MRKIIVLAAACLSVTALLAQRQFTQLSGPALDVRAAVWNPQVGQGSEYDVTNNGTKAHVSFMIVGQENTSGQTAYWLETGMNDERMGQIYLQMLMSLNSGRLHGSKWVVQLAKMPPMEMPEGGIHAGRGASESPRDSDSDYRTGADRVGIETITVPAGTFACEHWRARNGSGEVWLSSTVVPYSVVRGVDKDGGTMILTKTISNAKSHLIGKPVPFDPSLFMGAGRGRP
jgi:hypothetical protein